MARQRIQNLGERGLNVDIQHTLLPPNVLTTVENVEICDQCLVAARGEKMLFRIGIEPRYHYEFTDVDNTRYFVVSNADEVRFYTESGDMQSIITGLGSGFVTFTSLNGILVFNSELSGPYYVDTSGGFGSFSAVSLPGWDANWRCLEIISYKYFLVAIGMTEDGNPYPLKIRWSNSVPDGSIPTQWDPQVSNDAGDRVLGDSPDEGSSNEIVTARKVRDSLYIVLTDSIYALDWVGGQYTMRTSRLNNANGSPARNGVAEWRNGVFLFTPNDLEYFNGQQTESLAINRIRKGMMTVINPRFYRRKAVVFLHKPSKRLYISYVAKWDEFAKQALVYNLENDTWSYHTYNAIVHGFGAFRKEADGLFSPSETDVVLYQADNTNTSWWISTKDENYTDWNDRVKTVKAERLDIPIEGLDGVAQVNKVWPEFEGAVPVEFKFCMRDTLSSDITWSPWYTVTPGVTHSIEPRLTGRLFGYSMRAQEAGGWKLGGLTFNWERNGER